MYCPFSKDYCSPECVFHKDNCGSVSFCKIMDTLNEIPLIQSGIMRIEETVSELQNKLDQ